MDQPKKSLARRTTVFLAKGWAYSLGFTGIYEEVQRIGRGLGHARQHIREKLADGPQNYRHETFNAAVARLGLDEAHLIRQARSFRIRANSWFAAFLLTVGWMCYLPWAQHPYSFFLIDFGVMLMTYARSITWHFRVCQVRDRELYSFGPWVLSPSRW